MSGVEGAGVKPILPKMPGLAMAHVEPAGVVGMRAAEGFCERILALGHGEDVHVVAHHAIAGDPDAVVCGVPGECGEIHAPVFVEKENVLPVISSLHHVVCDAGRDEPSQTTHSGTECSPAPNPLIKK